METKGERAIHVFTREDKNETDLVNLVAFNYGQAKAILEKTMKNPDEWNYEGAKDIENENEFYETVYSFDTIEDIDEETGDEIAGYECLCCGSQQDESGICLTCGADALDIIFF